MSYVQEVFKDLLYYTPAKIAPAIINFAAVLAFTRLLSPDAYGQYTLTITSISFVSATVFAWVSSAGIRFWEEHKSAGTLRQIFSNLVLAQAALYLIVAVAGFGLIHFLSFYFDAGICRLHRIGVIVLGVNVFYLLIISILRADRDTVRFAVHSTLYPLGSTIFAIIAILVLNAGAQAMLWGMFISGGAICMVAMPRLIRSIGLAPSLFSWKSTREYAIYGIPLVGVGFSTLILSDSARYVIAYFGTAAEAGIYVAAYTIANSSLGLLFSILLPAVLPVAIQVYEREGEKKAAELLSYVMSLYLLLLVPSVVGMSVLSREIAGVLLPQSFMHSEVIIPWVAVGVFCYGGTNLISYPFILKKRTAYLLVFILIAGALNVGLNVFLVPNYSLLGAGISSFIAYAAYLALTWIFSARILPVPVRWHSFLKIFISAGAMGTLLFYMHGSFGGIQGLLIKATAGFLIYSVCLVTLREQTTTGILRGAWKLYATSQMIA